MRPARHPSAIAARGVVALLLVTALLVSGSLTGTARARQATVTVSSRSVTRPLPQGFVGLALTYNALPKWVSPSGPVDPVLVALIRNLTPSGRPSLRVGGESADRSWWPIAGADQPKGITYRLGPAWIGVARRLALATDAQLSLGLELEAGEPKLDAVEARALLHGIGTRYVQSLQIGNEPDLYSKIPWYRVLNGRPVVWYSRTGTPVFARPLSYGPSQYVSEVTQILHVIPDYPISGPETNGLSWMQAFSGLLAPSGRVTTLTTHAYGVNGCVKKRRLDVYPSVSNLVSLHASRDLLSGMTPYIALAHRRGDRFLIDEMGAVTCTGRAGVSNTMASALWAIDALFDAARQGVDGVNLHTDYSRINNLFTLHSSHGQWRATVRPLYYGALLFEQADPAGSRLLDVDGGTTDALRVWASRGRDRRVRIAIVNDSLRSAEAIRLRVPATVRSASGTIERLQATGKRGAYATGGITLGGRSFGTTATGTLAAPELTPVRVRRGALRVVLSKGSAALVTLSPDR
jgi:hypothetical protein